MKELLAELETKLLNIEKAGFSDDLNQQLSDERDWHDARQLVARLKQRVALLDANPDMSHGLKAPPSSARIAN